MTRFGKFLTKIAAFTMVSLTYGSAMASSFSGEVPVGYSDSRFQISGGASSLVIDIGALGSRDPAACASCNSIYTDNYTVNLFNQAGTAARFVVAQAGTTTHYARMMEKRFLQSMMVGQLIISDATNSFGAGGGRRQNFARLTFRKCQEPLGASESQLG